jgi:micrococcal nuclease
MRVFAITVRGLVASAMLCLLGCLPAWAWEGYVTGTADGDSFKVAKGKGGRAYEVRLYGIDSPEYGQPNWQEARALTKKLVLGKFVNIEPLDTDRYGRIIALVRQQGQLVNSELVRNGLAWVYPQYCQAQPLCNDLKVLEQAARKQRLGVWREKAPTPPWQWRRLQE